MVSQYRYRVVVVERACWLMQRAGFSSINSLRGKLDAVGAGSWDDKEAHVFIFICKAYLLVKPVTLEYF